MTRLQMPNTLYTVYSYLNNYNELGEVCLEWVYHQRKSPIAPYNDLIQDYNLLTDQDQEYGRRRVDEMFTDDEVTALRGHLEEVHKIESFTIEKPLPISIGDMVDARIPPRDIWVPGSVLMFSKVPGYKLPFDVWAYYDFRRNPI